MSPGGILASRPGFSLIPCAVTRDQLRRQARRASVQTHDRRDASTTAIRKTLSAA